MYFLWISEQTVTFALYIINRLGFITKVEDAVRYGLGPYITLVHFVLKGLI